MHKNKRYFMALIMVLLTIVFIPVFGGEISVEGSYGGMTPEELYDELQRLQTENAQLRVPTVTPAPTPSPTPKPVGPAKLQLVAPTTVNVVNGTMKDIELTIRNFGSSAAANVFNAAVASADAPFQVQFTQTSTNIINLSGNSEVILALTVKVNAEAKEGTYPVTLTYKYKDSGDNLITDTDTLNIKVTSSATQPDLTMVDFKASEPVLTAGSSFKLTASLANIGGTEAKNIRLLVEGMSSDSIYMSNTSSTYQYNLINQNQRLPIEFDFVISNKAKAGTNLLTFKILYKDKDNKDLESSFAYYVTVTPSTTSEEKAAVEIINLTSPTEDIAPGQEFTVSMDVVNNGANTAKNIKIVAAADTDDAIVPRSSNMTVINSLAVGESTRIEFKFTPTAKAKSQNYALSFKAEYETGALDSSDKAEKLSFEQYTGVNVITEAENTKSAVLTITSIDGPSGSFGVGESFNVSLEVTNIGEYPAKNLKIASATDADGAVVPMSSNSTIISSLEVGESTVVTFSFAPTEKARTRNYAIEFNAEYETGIKDSAGVVLKESFQQFFGVNVINDEPEATPVPSEARLSRPKIIIESYAVDPIIVKAGQEYDLRMTFKNTHDTKAITNIKAVLTPNETTANNKGAVFIPVSGSNTFYIDRIEPLATTEKTFRMYTIPDADPRNYTITVSFEYQDDELYDHKESEIIGVTVKQTTRLSTGNYSIPEEGYVGSPIYLYFSIMNTGKSTLNNLTVTIEGNFDTSKSFNYFGTVNKSSSAYYDGEFTPTEPGTQEGKIIMTFEDETGEVTTVERDFVIEVIDMSEMMAGREEMSMDIIMPEEPKSILDTAKEYAAKPIVWAGAAALLVVIIVIRRIIKKKKQVKFDE